MWKSEHGLGYNVDRKSEVKSLKILFHLNLRRRKKMLKKREQSYEDPKRH